MQSTIVHPTLMGGMRFGERVETGDVWGAGHGARRLRVWNAVRAAV